MKQKKRIIQIYQMFKRPTDTSLPPKRKRQTFGTNVHIRALNVEPTKELAEVLCVNPIAHDKQKLTEWVENVILDDFIINGSTSKFITLEKYKKLAIPILIKMAKLTADYQIEIFKYSEFQKIIRKASLGECFSEAEDESEDSVEDDNDEFY